MVLNGPGAEMPTIMADIIAPLVTTTSGAHAPVIDWSVAQIFPFLLGNNTTFSFVNAIPGETITLKLTQDGTGSRTGTFPAACIFVGGTNTLTTTAAAIDTVTVKCITAGQFLCNLAAAYA